MLGQAGVSTGGGREDGKTVTDYEEDGTAMELPQLITGRSRHGCSSYMDSDNNMVLLVVGGYDIRSTELQVTRSSPWKEVAPYPLAVSGLSGATMGNIVFMTGGRDDDEKYSDKIYKYDEQNDQWRAAGNMKANRAWHAVSVVDRKFIFSNCL